MNVLVVAPHPDDESIGCGGAVLRHADSGDVVTAVYMTSGERGIRERPAAEAIAIREGEAAAAGETLGIARLEFLRRSDWLLCDQVDEAAAGLAAVVAETAPDIVYVPYPGDAHPDHRAAAAVARRVLSARDAAIEVRAYEVWTPLPSHDVVVDITDVLDRKLAAIACHASQCRERDYVRAARALSEYRGALDLRYEYAEVFARLGSDASWRAPGDVSGWAPG